MIHLCSDYYKEQYREDKGTYWLVHYICLQCNYTWAVRELKK